MSRVIKQPNLNLVEPMVINHRKPAALNPVRSGPESEPRVRQEQVDMQKVVQEAETMVMELMEKARREARAIIADAQEDAEMTRDQALREAEGIKTSAYKEGYAKGLRDAQLESEADRQMAIEQCQQMLEEARRNKIKIMDSASSDMVRLALAAAKKIVASEINTNPQVISHVIREAINLLDQPGNVHIYVNPQELENAVAGIEAEDITEMEKQELKNELVADSRIAAGGCVVESDAGTVDARLDTRIAKVEQVIQEVIADEASESL